MLKFSVTKNNVFFQMESVEVIQLVLILDYIGKEIFVKKLINFKKSAKRKNSSFVDEVYAACVALIERDPKYRLSERSNDDAVMKEKLRRLRFINKRNISGKSKYMNSNLFTAVPWAQFLLIESSMTSVI